MFDGFVSPHSRSAVVYRGDRAHWRPRFSRTLLCGTLKRGFDVLIASIVVPFLMPAFAVKAAAIVLDSRAPILFRQERTGLNGRVFTIYKFRSTTVALGDASVRNATLDDSRVTKIGKLIRETSLDELPQLFNILRGEMALVGPRPHAVEHYRHYASLLPSMTVASPSGRA